MSALALPANRVPEFTVTVPAGTLSSAPASTDTTFLQAVVSLIRVRIPDGHVGLTGIRFLYSDAQVIPFEAGTWIVGNDDTIELPITGYPTGGQWSVQAYNTDVFNHSFYVLYLTNDQTLIPTAVVPLTVAPVLVV